MQRLKKVNNRKTQVSMKIEVAQLTLVLPAGEVEEQIGEIEELL